MYRNCQNLENPNQTPKIQFFKFFQFLIFTTNKIETPCKVPIFWPKESFFKFFSIFFTCREKNMTRQNIKKRVILYCIHLFVRPYSLRCTIPCSQSLWIPLFSKVPGASFAYQGIRHKAMDACPGTCGTEQGVGRLLSALDDFFNRRHARRPTHESHKR